MDERDTPMDEGLRALYRGLPADAPPPALDAAILKASRGAVATRTRRPWSVSLALAAVLVLSVTVTLRVAEERPDLEPVPVARAPEAPPRVAPAAEAQGGRPAGPRAKSTADVVALEAEPRREQAPAAAPPPAPAFVPSPPAVASSEGAMPAERTRDAAPVAATAAAPALAAVPAERSLADTAKRSAGAANVAAPLAPEAWLERIAGLRAQARHEEADESYAAFRKRYPEFVVAPEVWQKIAPPR